MPAPKDVLGFTLGDDYKLADYAGKSSTYFQRVAAVSDPREACRIPERVPKAARCTWP